MTPGLIGQIQKEWKGVFPDRLFEYQTLQQDLMKKYEGDIFFYKLVIAFSIISLIISCFGLFAVSWAVIQSRVKEIALRKVFGASGKKILVLLTMTFLKRIAVAFLLSVPIAYYVMEKWLEHFVKRIAISPVIFATAAIVILITSFATLSIQLVKAVVTNPLDELKAE
jgi:putative ABC transport system permease protein